MFSLSLLTAWLIFVTGSNYTNIKITPGYGMFVVKVANNKTVTRFLDPLSDFRMFRANFFKFTAARKLIIFINHWLFDPKLYPNSPLISCNISGMCFFLFCASTLLIKSFAMLAWFIALVWNSAIVHMIIFLLHNWMQYEFFSFLICFWKLHVKVMRK